MLLKKQHCKCFYGKNAAFGQTFSVMWQILTIPLTVNTNSMVEIQQDWEETRAFLQLNKAQNVQQGGVQLMTEGQIYLLDI